MNWFVHGTESLRLLAADGQALSLVSASFFKVFFFFFFTELCIAAVFLTFSKTAANYSLNEWVNTHEFTCATCWKQPG